MESGYKIFWTHHALNELAEIFRYLEENFTQKELNKLAVEIDKDIQLLSKNPDVFPVSEKQGIHRVVIMKFNTLYYKKKENTVEILSFFHNRKHPRKKKL